MGVDQVVEVEMVGADGSLIVATVKNTTQNDLGPNGEGI